MRIIITVLFVVAVVGLVQIGASAYTVSFDEVPSGTQLRYSSIAVNNKLVFDEGFRTANHQSSGWTIAHSGSNVMAWDKSVGPPFFAAISFGELNSAGGIRYKATSVSGYFSTKPGAVVKITKFHFDHGDHGNLVPIGSSTVIGSATGSWTNQLVTLDSSDGVFDSIQFDGVNSVNDMSGFCVDDLTITPVPEPSSLLALFGGLVGVGGFVMKRRKR